MKKVRLVLIALIAIAGMTFSTGWPEQGKAAQKSLTTPPKNFRSYRADQDQLYNNLSTPRLKEIRQNNSGYTKTSNPGLGDNFSATSSTTTGNSKAQAGDLVATTTASGHEVFGYVPYWMGPVWDSFRWSSLSTAAWFKIVVDYKGDMIIRSEYEPPADLIAKAHAHGVKVVLTVTSVDASSVNTLIFSPHDYAKAADNIVAKVISSGTDGVNVDFEGLDGARTAGFTSFMQVLTDKMHTAKADSEVSTTLPAIDWSNAYDSAALASVTDKLIVMGYDYFGAWSSTAGPVAPLYDPAWRTGYSIDATITNYLSKVPASQLILALPWYGHKWTTTTTGVPGTTISSQGSLIYSSAYAEAQNHGKSWYSPSQATYTSVPGSPDQQSWYDDYASLLAKYYFANDKKLAGIGIWALGYDGGHSEMWDALDAYGNPSAQTLKRLPLQGAGNRFDTANAISQDAFAASASASSVTLTNAYNWPDALAGAVLAHKKNGPLLITDPNHLSASSASEIKRILPAGGQVYLLGGTVALSDQVAQDVTKLGFKVTRYAGKNRQETAAQIAQALGVAPSKIMIGTKNNFADALSLAPHSASDLIPILLSDPNRLSDEIENYLNGSLGKNVKEVIIAGGTAAVKSAVSDRLVARGLKVTRLAGLNRYETSAKIAAHFVNNPIEICLATGLEAVDGLAGGPHAAVHGAPILLTKDNDLPGSIQNYLKSNAGPIKQGYIYGGYTAISPNVQSKTEQIIKL